MADMKKPLDQGALDALTLSTEEARTSYQQQRLTLEAERKVRTLDQELTQLRTDVREGLGALDTGKHSPFDDEAVERIKRTARAVQLAVKSKRS